MRSCLSYDSVEYRQVLWALDETLFEASSRTPDCRNKMIEMYLILALTMGSRKQHLFIRIGSIDENESGVLNPYYIYSTIYKTRIESLKIETLSR